MIHFKNIRKHLYISIYPSYFNNEHANHPAEYPILFEEHRRTYHFNLIHKYMYNMYVHIKTLQPGVTKGSLQPISREFPVNISCGLKDLPPFILQVYFNTTK